MCVKKGVKREIGKRSGVRFIKRTGGQKEIRTSKYLKKVPESKFLAFLLKKKNLFKTFCNSYTSVQIATSGGKISREDLAQT